MRLLLLWRVLLLLEAGEEEEEVPNRGGGNVRQRMGLPIGITLLVGCRNGTGLREGGREGGKGGGGYRMIRGVAATWDEGRKRGRGREGWRGDIGWREETRVGEG